MNTTNDLERWPNQSGLTFQKTFPSWSFRMDILLASNYQPRLQVERVHERSFNNPETYLTLGEENVKLHILVLEL